MNNNGPVLSICIPTYNRAEYLEKCLDNIVSQDGFDQDVEVVISDNCSDDNTKELCERFQDRYSNIHYYRNEENVIDKNYYLVFHRATGKLRKLTNDTVIYKPGAIMYMKGVAEKYYIDKPQIYFLNTGKQIHDCRVDSMEEYIGQIGYLITWIASIAIWDDDCDDLHTLVENADTRIGQIPFLLENFEKRHSAIICDQFIMNHQSVYGKDLSYGLYHVFYEVFLEFLLPYVNSGKISKNCYENMRKSLLLDFFCLWIINKEFEGDKYNWGDENLKELVENAYKTEPYYKEFFLKKNTLRIKAITKRMIYKLMRRKY